MRELIRQTVRYRGTVAWWRRVKDRPEKDAERKQAQKAYVRALQEYEQLLTKHGLTLEGEDNGTLFRM
jgi:hypothetical protein